MRRAWILLTVLCLGCESQLPTDVNTVYDPTTGTTRQEVVSVAQFAGVTIAFNHTRQLIEVENGNDVAVRVRIVRSDRTVLLDRWVILAGWQADKSVRFNRGDLVTITVWHINLALDPLDEFTEAVRL